MVVEAQSWSLAQVRLSVLCCRLMEMGSVLAMVDVKKLEKVGGGVRGAMLQTDVLWTSLANGPLIWFNFALEGAFCRSKYLCEMKHINLEVQFGI